MAKDFMGNYKTYDTSNGFGNSKRWRSSFEQKLNSEEVEEILKAQNDTPHQILGVAIGASQQEIKTAFRNKMREWHPDYNPHRIEEATEMAKKINAAYTYLKS